MTNSSLPWLWKVPGAKKLYILALALVQALHGASGVVYALLLREIVDAAAGHDRGGFVRNAVLIVLLAAGQLALRAVIRWLTELSKSSFENIFKGRLMETLLHRDYLRVSAVHSGEWLNRLTNDTVVVANGYVEIIPGLAGMVVKLVSALVMILVLEPRFAAVFIPGGALMVFFTWLFRRRLKQLHKKIQEADGQLRVFLQERVGNLLMIRSFAAEGQTEADTADKMQHHQDSRMRRSAFSNLANIGFGAAMSGMYLLGVIWCGYGILLGTITFGTLTAITQLIAQIQTPFANITGYLPRYYAMLASAERLREAEEFEEDEMASGAAVSDADVASCAETADSKASSKVATRGVLTIPEVSKLYCDLVSFGLSDVSFSYYPAAEGAEQFSKLSKDNMPPVLEHFSMEIQKGDFVAMTGHSGCGKSTALKLLMCVCKPDSGERYYVDRFGRRGLLTAAHRRLFAYVPQGNALMNGTIREVVSFAEPSAAHDEERLDRALRTACADGFVSELPAGVDTLLGERGTGLSEGQMQRLAVARAIFAGSPVLLLDEATSALDAETERRLLQNLKEMTDKTVLIVTHRKTVEEMVTRVVEFH